VEALSWMRKKHGLQPALPSPISQHSMSWLSRHKWIMSARHHLPRCVSKKDSVYDIWKQGDWGYERWTT